MGGSTRYFDYKLISLKTAHSRNNIFFQILVIFMITVRGKAQEASAMFNGTQNRPSKILECVASESHFEAELIFSACFSKKEKRKTIFKIAEGEHLTQTSK